MLDKLKQDLLIAIESGKDIAWEYNGEEEVASDIFYSQEALDAVIEVLYKHNLIKKAEDDWKVTCRKGFIFFGRILIPKNLKDDFEQYLISEKLHYVMENYTTEGVDFINPYYIKPIL